MKGYKVHYGKYREVGTGIIIVRTSDWMDGYDGMKMAWFKDKSGHKFTMMDKEVKRIS